jgi:hypothetical protein
MKVKERKKKRVRDHLLLTILAFTIPKKAPFFLSSSLFVRAFSEIKEIPPVPF